jgi:hypothetical protein
MYNSSGVHEEFKGIKTIPGARTVPVKIDSSTKKCQCIKRDPVYQGR